MKKIFAIFCILCLLIIPICSGTMKVHDIVHAENDVLQINAKASLLMDYNTNTIIYENNSKARLPVASMVKIMTLLLTYEAIDNGSLTLDTMITTTENASKMGGSQVFIDPYVEYKTEDEAHQVHDEIQWIQEQLKNAASLLLNELKEKHTLLQNHCTTDAGKAYIKKLETAISKMESSNKNST